MGPGRAYGEISVSPFLSRAGRTQGKQEFPWVRRKDDFISPDHIEQGFDACPVMEQAQTVFGSVQDGNG